jgi:hypothetical protein
MKITSASKAAGMFVLIGSPVAAAAYHLSTTLLATNSQTPIKKAFDQAGFLTFGSDHIYDAYSLWLVPVLLACFVYLKSRRIILSYRIRLLIAPCCGAFVLLLLRVLVIFVENGNYSTTFNFTSNVSDMACGVAAGAVSSFLCALFVEEIFCNLASFLKSVDAARTSALVHRTDSRRTSLHVRKCQQEPWVASWKAKASRAGARAREQ